MAMVRIVPRDEEAFPYEKALQLLQGIPGVIQSETDISSIVQAGVRIGWPEELIQWHYDVMRAGGVYDFTVNGEEGVSCTLWPENIVFRFFSKDHERACVPVVVELARALGCIIIR